MKNLTILGLCALTIFSACKKKTEEPVDARDQYLGTWEGTMTTTVLDLSILNVETDKEVITKTANTTNKITLTDASDATERMTATVNGNSIIFEQGTRIYHGDGYTATLTINGTGTISGKALSATGTLKVTKNGSTYDGSWSASWAKK